MADERRREKRRLKPSRDARPPFPKPVVRHKDNRRAEKHKLRSHQNQPVPTGWDSD